MLKVDTTSPSTKFTPAFRDRYIIRCIDEDFGLSSKQNPMITLSFEICGHQGADGKLSQTIKRGGTEYMIAGKKCSPMYFTLIDGFAGQNYLEFRQKAKLEVPEEGINPENPPLDHKGIVLSAILSVQESIQRKALTDEEKTAGKQVGDPITDENGKQVINYRINIDQILGKSSVEINTPF